MNRFRIGLNRQSVDGKKLRRIRPGSDRDRESDPRARHGTAWTNASLFSSATGSLAAETHWQPSWGRRRSGHQATRVICHRHRGRALTRDCESLHRPSYGVSLEAGVHRRYAGWTQHSSHRIGQGFEVLLALPSSSPMSVARATVRRPSCQLCVARASASAKSLLGVVLCRLLTTDVFNFGTLR
ncbi:MAG: hypothetical protein QOI29_3319 [Mycobacterium sp.]|jgi:hypothetical protein|nr:hypothetical protein [Mycobacterium sp.]